MKTLIIDNAINSVQQDLIEKTIFSKDTQWTLGRTVFYDSHPEVTAEQRKSLMSFTKSLYRIDDNFSVPDIDLYFDIIRNVEPQLDFKIGEWLTARVQLQIPTNQNKPYGVPHVDGYRRRPYIVGVYYVNDSDGDTVLFKQTIHNATPNDIKNGKLEIAETISPKKGRLVLFDGNIYHAVGKPTKDLRCIINYNFFKK